MARKKTHDLRDMALEDLQNLERDRAEELMNLRLRLKLRQVDNPLSVRNARRELAAIKTVINQKRKAAL